MELFKDANYDFLGKKWPFIIGSVVLLAAGLADLARKGGPRYGIDFKGGTLMYVRFAQQPSDDQLRAALSAQIKGEIIVQDVRGVQEKMIGTEIRDEKELDATRRQIFQILGQRFGGDATGKLDLNNNGQQAIADRLREPMQRASVAFSEQQLQDLTKAVTQYRDTPPRSGLIKSMEELASVPGMPPQALAVFKQETYPAGYAIRNIEIVGPRIGKELQAQAVQATLLALGGMLVYIGFRFEWIYGVAAVLAVFHDTLVTIGLFSIFNKELSLTVVAAVLTLVGYSMNDTIVVFDRIRENLKLKRREHFHTIVNSSINETLSRTIMTSGLTFLTCISLFLFGGQVLHGFSFALVVGIIVGTYSSIFIASPILIFWQDWVESRKRVAGAPAVGRAKTVK